MTDRQLNRIESMGAMIYGVLLEVRDLLLDVSESEATAITTLGETIMADFSALADEITANSNAVDSAVALINSIADQLEAGATDQATIDQFVSDLRANSQELAQAVAENTPAAPGGDTGTGTGDTGTGDTGGVTVDDGTGGTV